ncbi:TlpA family protein disulfide reductase [Kitasatospora sp. NBC_01250]|uniref:TlpA family protein disulfide reductase n=1 Tax=unclassified Kitasatospora TaxID=2633591 RepID=UPI002E114C1B|nr:MULTISPECIES: TlpA disulfide reductase family protein [unclassified Kitasatospora]WSJ67811.1 TlpA family protein disulfide reductase [Kitasatospora sp. NBC_01302]
MSGTPRFRLAALFTAAAAVLALAGCSSTGSGGSADAQTGFITGTGGVDTVPLANRKPAPAISGKDLENKQVALSDYTGKIVVINIWGSWCSPCRKEAAGLEQSYQKYKDQGVEFLGINTRDTDPTNARQFEANQGITYPSIYDPDGTQILKFPKGSLNPQTIPTTMVVDRQGRLAARAMRPVSIYDMDAILEPLLAEQHS